MAQTTYQKYSEEIIKAHYVAFPSPEQQISQRFIAERVAMKVAKYATISAFGNSKAGEVTYSNDQFISVFYSCPLLTDATTKDKYSVMPATPAGLPNGREIEQISFTGFPNVQVIPCQNRMAFVESLLPTIPQQEGIQQYKIENGNVVFPNLPSIISSSVNMKLVGATLTGDLLLQQLLNCPKETEDLIMVEILNELAMDYKIQPQTLEVGEPTS